MNKRILLTVTLFILLIGAIFLYTRPYQTIVNNAQNTPAEKKPMAPEQSSVTVGGTKIFVTVATTTAQITKGLSGQPSLPPQQGMLFVFHVEDIYHFWMPNMNFPLDMIWIGANMKVVDITKKAPPLADITKPIFYTPRVPAQYVLEVNGGFSDAQGISIGEDVQFFLK